MQFYDKLDFLMNITKTTNNALAACAGIDASHISRLRRGQRSMPKSEACLRQMAASLAETCSDAHQRKAVMDLLGISPVSFDPLILPDLLFEWLVNDKSTESKSIEAFLNDFSGFKPRKNPPANLEPAGYPQAEGELSVYYGVEGKRQAALFFISEVLNRKKPGFLYLFSDEDLAWLTDNRAFTELWSNLMAKALLLGNKMKVIHTVSRNLDEMLTAISQWMPLYMTGMIEPFYYPKKRDGVFKRTLFIAPDIAALTSCSVGTMAHCAANLLSLNKELIHSFKEEFDQYFTQCKPLMRIFTPIQELGCLSGMIELGKKPAATLIQTESLSLNTMPPEVIRAILARHDISSPISHINYLTMSPQTFSDSLRLHAYTEIIRLPDKKEVLEGKVPIAFSGMLGIDARYRPEEYVAHLEHIVSLLQSQEHYHVHLLKSSKREKPSVYAKEDAGVFVFRSDSPPVAISISESNLTAAFWDYLKNLIGEKPYTAPNNTLTANKLQKFLLTLKQ